MPPRSALHLAPACLTACVLLSILLTACRGSGRKDAQPDIPSFTREGARLLVPDASPLRARLLVEPVTRSLVRSKLQAPASVEADPARMAKVAPPLPGRVVSLHVRFGDKVAKGQPLLELAAPDHAQAQADLLRAQAQVAQGERTRARQQDLGEHAIGARRDLEQAETDLATSRAELERARVRLRLLGGDPGRLGRPLTVRAPIGGRIIDLAVAQGEFKNDPNAVLMTIADLSVVWLTANVQEKDLRRVRVGEEAAAAFSAWPGETFTGKVAFIGEVLDADTRTVKVRISFPNPLRHLKPGMFATVTLTGDPVPELLVPTTALLLDHDQTYVFAEVAPMQFERRVVVPGEQQGARTVIAKGLDEGARVVSRDAVLLQ